ncbi:MAG: hypothetical protein J5710_06165 [Treponema sp.]|nr:hypothetical protein [Treponema sp.]
MNRFDKLREQHQNAVEEFKVNTSAIANEAGRVAVISRDSEQIINDIDKQFEKVTKLTKTDIVFLFIAVGLQCCRQYLLPNDFNRITDKEGDKKVKSVLEKTIKGDKKKKKEIIEILTQSVPYDATKRSDGFKELFGDLSTGLSGATHRYRTLGHDPVLGWFFGTANILTDSLTKYNFIETYSIVNMKIDGPYISDTIPGGQIIPTVSMISDFFTIAEEDTKLLFTAIARQAIHFGSDYFTKQGLPIPFIPTTSNDFSKFLTTRCNIDTRAVLRSAATAILINKIIEYIHSLFYNADKDYSYDVYKIRTNKIISYSNLIASTSNVLYVAISASLGNEEAFKKLDVGGIIVTIHRLITDMKFRNEIKKEFLEKEFYKKVMGDGNLMEEYK